jgi:adenylate kinase family enzyme
MGGARLHITGASGAGTTTLGRALAQRFASPHFDTDDFFWEPTDPPYRRKRAEADRLRLLGEMLGQRRDWVLSGSLDGWGDKLVASFDLVVWLDVPAATRLARLRASELARYGAAIAPGGALYAEHQEFLAGAATYDTGERSGRSRPRHQAWLAGLPCPVLRLAGDRPTGELVAEVAAALPA